MTMQCQTTLALKQITMSINKNNMSTRNEFNKTIDCHNNKKGVQQYHVGHVSMSSTGKIQHFKRQQQIRPEKRCNIERHLSTNKCKAPTTVQSATQHQPVCCPLLFSRFHCSSSLALAVLLRGSAIADANTGMLEASAES